MTYDLRSRDAIAPVISGDEVSIFVSSAVSLPSAAEALSMSSADAEVEVDISTEMSESPSLGTPPKSLSVGELAWSSLSGFPSRLGLIPSYTPKIADRPTSGTLALDVQLNVVPAAVQPTAAVTPTLSFDTTVEISVCFLRVPCKWHDNKMQTRSPAVAEGPRDVGVPVEILSGVERLYHSITVYSLLYCDYTIRLTNTDRVSVSA